MGGISFVKLVKVFMLDWQGYGSYIFLVRLVRLGKLYELDLVGYNS